MTDFKITGPGEYRTRDGRKAVVKRNNNGGSYCWQGKIGEEYYDWTEYGSYWNKGVISINDIIGPWVEQATVSSVLTYAGITKKPSDVLTWLEFVTIMNDPASAIVHSPKAEKQSEDEAAGNEACAEAGSALKDAIGVITSCFGVGGHILACHIADELKANGYTIIPTSSLRDNRNGCYNTRTDKETD